MRIMKVISQGFGVPDVGGIKRTRTVRAAVTLVETKVTACELLDRSLSSL